MKTQKFVIALSVAAMLAPGFTLVAKAGVDKQLIEIDEAQRLREEQERIRAQEDYRRAAEAQRQAALEAEARSKAMAETKTYPTETIGRGQQQIAQTPVSSSTSHSGDTSIFLRILGATVGLPVAAVTGVIKGGLSKGNEMADSLSDHWDKNKPTEVAGDVTGGLIGGVSGAATGLLDGAITGVKTGWDDPFSAESFLWDSGITDYDPFDIGADS